MIDETEDREDETEVDEPEPDYSDIVKQLPLVEMPQESAAPDLPPKTRRVHLAKEDSKHVNAFLKQSLTWLFLNGHHHVIRPVDLLVRAKTICPDIERDEVIRRIGWITKRLRREGIFILPCVDKHSGRGNFIFGYRAVNHADKEDEVGQRLITEHAAQRASVAAGFMHESMFIERGKSPKEADEDVH